MNIYDLPPEIEISDANSKLPIIEKRYSSIENEFGINIESNKTPPRAVLFSDQFIDSRWALVFGSDKQHILQSEYLKPAELLKSIKEKTTKSVNMLDPHFSYFLGYNHDHANYYHWVMQCLPTILLFKFLQKKKQHLKLLLPENLSHFALEYLHILKLDLLNEVVFLKNSNNLYFAKSLYYPSFLGGEFAYNVSPLILSFYREILSTVIEHSNSSTIKKNEEIVYFSRLDSKNRRITNEEELIKNLQKKFSAKILTNNVSVAEQIVNYNSAKIIISPHGAGLANLVYCQKDTRLIELIPEKYINPCFATIAVNSGIKYQSLFFPITNITDHQHSIEWEVNFFDIESQILRLPAFK